MTADIISVFLMIIRYHMRITMFTHVPLLTFTMAVNIVFRSGVINCRKNDYYSGQIFAKLKKIKFKFNLIR